MSDPLVVAAISFSGGVTVTILGAYLAGWKRHGENRADRQSRALEAKGEVLIQLASSVEAMVLNLEGYRDILPHVSPDENPELMASIIGSNDALIKDLRTALQALRLKYPEFPEGKLSAVADFARLGSSQANAFHHSAEFYDRYSKQLRGQEIILRDELIRLQK